MFFGERQKLRFSVAPGNLPPAWAEGVGVKIKRGGGWGWGSDGELGVRVGGGRWSVAGDVVAEGGVSEGGWGVGRTSGRWSVVDGACVGGDGGRKGMWTLRARVHKGRITEKRSIRRDKTSAAVRTQTDMTCIVSCIHRHTSPLR